MNKNFFGFSLATILIVLASSAMIVNTSNKTPVKVGHCYYGIYNGVNIFFKVKSLGKFGAEITIPYGGVDGMLFDKCDQDVTETDCPEENNEIIRRGY